MVLQPVLKLHREQCTFVEGRADLDSQFAVTERGKLNELYYTTQAIKLTHICAALVPQNPYDRDNWQLVRRFFIVDIFSARNQSYRSQFYSNENRPEKYMSLRYLRAAEFSFKLDADHRQHGNKISVPLLILEYGDVRRPHNYSVWDATFNFKITFIKRISMTTWLDVSGVRIQYIPNFLLVFSMENIFVCETDTFANISDHRSGDGHIPDLCVSQA